MKKLIAREGLFLICFALLLGWAQHSYTELSEGIESKEGLIHSRYAIYAKTKLTPLGYEECGRSRSTSDDDPCDAYTRREFIDLAAYSLKLDDEYGLRKDREKFKLIKSFRTFILFLIPIFYLGRFIIWATKTLRGI